MTVEWISVVSSVVILVVVVCVAIVSYQRDKSLRVLVQATDMFVRTQGDRIRVIEKSSMDTSAESARESVRANALVDAIVECTRESNAMVRQLVNVLVTPQEKQFDRQHMERVVDRGPVVVERTPDVAPRTPDIVASIPTGDFGDGGMGPL